MTGRPYARVELANAPTWPERGPVCERCGKHVPTFADLSDGDAARLFALVTSSRAGEAISELQRITGCTARWAKFWLLHRGRPQRTAPCPNCGGALRTAKARQCHHCLHEWRSGVVRPLRPG